MKKLISFILAGSLLMTSTGAEAYCGLVQAHPAYKSLTQSDAARMQSQALVQRLGNFHFSPWQYVPSRVLALFGKESAVVGLRDKFKETSIVGSFRAVLSILKSQLNPTSDDYLLRRKVYATAPEWLTWSLVGATVTAVFIAQFQVVLDKSLPAGLVLACGLVGVIWKLDPNQSQLKQLPEIREYFWKVLDAVSSRGPQAAGITLFVLNRKGQVVAKRFRLVPPKRIALSRLMVGALGLYVIWLWLTGHRFLPYVEIFSHVRFATGGPPGVRETHLLRFGPAEELDVWKFSGTGEMVRQKELDATMVRKILPVETQIGKNGDISEWYIYGGWMPLSELKTLLQKVFHLENDGEVNKTKVDSFIAAGLGRWLLTQSSWVAAIRMANGFYVVDNENGHFPDTKELNDWAIPFESVFISYQSEIKSRGYTSYADFTEDDVAELTRRLIKIPMPKIPDGKKKQFIEAAIHGFLFMDPNLAARVIIERGKGSAENSFAFEIINPLHPHTVTVAAYKQAVSIAVDPEAEILAWASEEQALAARRTRSGKPLPWILNLRDGITEGEIAQVSPQSIRLYSLKLGREYTAAELLAQKRLLPNNETNPYWSELPEAPKKGTRAEQSLKKIPKVFQDILDSMNDPTSQNFRTSVAFSDLNIQRGIYKDISYKSRVNRIEDYSTLADEINERSGELLRARIANPKAPESEFRAAINAEARQVFDTVVAFDFLKLKLRKVIEQFLLRNESETTELASAQAETSLRDSLRKRIPDDELVHSLVAGLKIQLKEVSSLEISERKGVEGHAEDIALRALDQASVVPSRLRKAYRRGQQESLDAIIFNIAEKGRAIIDDNSLLTAARDTISNLFDKPEPGLVKTVDRRDPDLVIYGHEIPKWMADHLASLYEKATPGLIVRTVTGNELLESMNQAGGIERRKNDFRVHIRSENGEFRFGKRTRVIGISQTFQTYPTKMPGGILGDLYEEYGAPNQFVVAGRYNTPGAKIVGQITHPDVPPVDRQWSNLTGWKPEDPGTDVPTAMNFLISARIFPFDILRMRTLLPTYPLFECKVSLEQAQKLWDEADLFVSKEIPDIVGVDTKGEILPNAGVARLLKEKATLWGKRFVEAALADHISWALITMVAFFHFTPWVLSQWFVKAIQANVLLHLSVADLFRFSSDPSVFGLGLIVGAIAALPATILHSVFLGDFANWLYYLPFMRWGVPFLIRLSQRRNWKGRRGQPTVAIAGPPHVSKTLRQLLTTLVSQQAYGGQGVNVHEGDPQGNFLALYAKQIVSSVLIFLGIPDGRRAAKTVGKLAAGMVATQATGIQSFGMGPTVLALGENLDETPKGATDSISLGSLPQNHLDPANNLFAELEESIYGSLKLLVSGTVFFVTAAVTASRLIPWMRFPLDHNQGGRTSTTRSGQPAPNASGGGNVNENLPPIAKTAPLLWKELLPSVEQPSLTDSSAAPTRKAFKIRSWIKWFTVGILLVTSLFSVERFVSKYVQSAVRGRAAPTQAAPLGSVYDSLGSLMSRDDADSAATKNLSQLINRLNGLHPDKVLEAVKRLRPLSKDAKILADLVLQEKAATAIQDAIQTLTTLKNQKASGQAFDASLIETLIPKLSDLDSNLNKSEIASAFAGQAETAADVQVLLDNKPDITVQIFNALRTFLPKKSILNFPGRHTLARAA